MPSSEYTCVFSQHVYAGELYNQKILPMSLPSLTKGNEKSEFPWQVIGTELGTRDVGFISDFLTNVTGSEVREEKPAPEWRRC